MKKITTAFLSLIIAVSTAVTGLTASAEEKTTPSGIGYENIGKEIDDYIEKYESGLVSCEVSVFDGDGVIYEGCYGYSDIENNIMADESTVYEWASCSKILVWVSVMQQYERGNLDLDEDIRTYLPEGFLKKIQYDDEKITMINLMNHDAGFQESWYENQQCGEDGIFDSLEDAVSYCECYQAFRPGEHTAYSNWGTALAAYIVETVSGEDYVSYVHENILEPLGMEHTSINPHISDNDYVREKRNELKCYYRGADRTDDEDYGTAISWVQLFPVGSTMSTISDFEKFGQALIADKCPLFENDSTRDIMFEPSSYYGDSDIAKNCHGLWTHEHMIQTLGHAGNSNCSSMIQFDPVSKLGVVIMTNEPGETIFNYGIPELIFGKMTDRPEYAGSPVSDKNDISGMYFPKRGIMSGAGSFQTYTFGFMPFSKNDDGTYGMPIDKEASLIKLADNQYFFESNGRSMFMYQSNDKNGNIMLEMMSQDMVLDKGLTAKMIFFWAVLILSVVCIVMLAVKLIISVVRKIRKSDKKFCINVTIQQSIYAVILCVMFSFLSILNVGSYAFTAFSCILAGILGLGSLANGCILCYNTIKAKELKKATAFGRYVWSVMGLAGFVFIFMFEFYKFWTL